MPRRLTLVTGAAGFVGGEVVRELLSHGGAVRALVRPGRAGPALSGLPVELVEGDLTDAASLRRAVQGVNGVIHLAALFQEAKLPESEFMRVNVDGTRALLDSAIEAGATRFIHCSTSGVMGGMKSEPGTEQSPYGPTDMYQRSKMEGEKLVLSYLQSGRIGGAVIRPAMIYGRGDKRLFKIFKMLSHGTFFYVGSGEARVHFIDVRDLARAFCLALQHEERNGEVYIIAGDRPVHLHQAISKICAIMNVPEPWLKLPVLPMQVLGTLCEIVCRPLGIHPPIYRRRVDFFTKNRWFDTDKARREIGFIPTQSLEDELIEVINEYISTGALKGKELLDPCVITRQLDGTIESWDVRAERLYGWGQHEATGNPLHKLLQTEYPQSLQRIEQELEQSKIWMGNVTQLRRDGTKITVLARFELDEASPRNAPTIRELHYPRDEEKFDPQYLQQPVEYGLG